MTPSDKSYSPLAWKIAKRAKLDTPEGWPDATKVRAAIVIGGTLFQSAGSTSNEAMQKLAGNIERWGRG